MGGPPPYRPFTVAFAVEGETDVPVVLRILESLGIEAGSAYVQRGKTNLDRKLPAYNNAARHCPWLILRDLDRDADCAPDLLTRLLPEPAEHLRFRLAVRAIEAWLLADTRAMAEFLRVSSQRLPNAPDELEDPKGALIAAAARSRDSSVRRDMVPPPAATARVGRGYLGRIVEFSSRWDPAEAATRSPSLRGCLQALANWRV